MNSRRKKIQDTSVCVCMQTYNCFNRYSDLNELQLVLHITTGLLCTILTRMYTTVD